MIAGRKIRLRPVEEHHLEFCQALFNDPKIRQVVVGWDFPASLAAQNKWFSSLAGDRNNIRLIIETNDEEVIGLTGLWDIDWHNRHALTAIKLKSEGTRGKGYGRDAIMAMCAYAFFEVGLRRLWGAIIDFNVPSYKAYVGKCGWKVEGILREHIFRNGVFHDLYYVACLKRDYLKVADAKEYILPAIPPGMGKIEVMPDCEKRSGVGEDSV